ncbi:MAG: hypothetical protein P4L99_25270 [Chthoniobacter sp.]|nr:hypothetical protein [Chthoniobacter sp.]
MAALFLAASNGHSEEMYSVGSAVSAFSANDQFGAPFKLGTDCRVLLISFDMATGKQANLKLSALGKDFLPEHHTVYMANIHEMPAIGRTFALPKMRSYAHRIVLADEATLLAPFPKQEKRVTVLLLQKRKITAIRFWDPEKEDIATILGGH